MSGPRSLRADPRPGPPDPPADLDEREALDLDERAPFGIFNDPFTDWQTPPDPDEDPAPLDRMWERFHARVRAIADGGER